MDTYVLCCIVAESADTETKKVVDKLHVIFLEIRILGIDIRQSSHAPECALGAVLIVGDGREAVGMEHFVTSSHSLVKFLRHCIGVESGMVRKNIHNYFYAISCSRIHHLFHLVAAAEIGVSHFPVGRLIIIVPVSFRHFLVEELLAASFRSITALHRRGLDHGETGLPYFLHAARYFREVPAPGMENGFSVDGIGIYGHSVFGCRRRGA